MLEDWDLIVLQLFLNVKYWNTDHKDLPCVHQCWHRYGHRYPKSVTNGIGLIRSNSYAIHVKCRWDEGKSQNTSAWELVFFLMFRITNEIERPKLRVWSHVWIDLCFTASLVLGSSSQPDLLLILQRLKSISCYLITVSLFNYTVQEQEKTYCLHI